MDTISIIDSMIDQATQEYEQAKEELDEAYEKQTTQFKSDYEKTKYDELQSYFQFIYSTMDPTSQEYQTILDRFPIFPHGFFEKIYVAEEKHQKDLEVMEMKYVHESHSLEIKYTDSVQKLNQLRENIPNNSSWFTLFEEEND